MGFYDFINNFNYYINLRLTFTEEIIVIFLFYNFLKLIIFGSLLELIWPTQFFNRKHSSNFLLIRFRTFTEVFLKLRPKLLRNKIFNKAFLKNIFYKGVSRLK